MSNFIMKPRVFPAYSGAIHDTFVACKDTGCSPYKYAHGQAKPHFPVPTVYTLRHDMEDYEHAWVQCMRWHWKMYGRGNHDRTQ